MPDGIFRTETLADDLAMLADRVGFEAPPLADLEPLGGFQLADLYDDDVEKAVQFAYERDYDAFGFTDWGSTQP
jgi:hypothetical protein